MTISEKLNEIKEQIVSNAEAKVKNLERNPPKFNAPPEQLQAYNAERDAALEAMILVHTRLADYRVRGTINYNCPLCWLRDGILSTVTPRGGGTRKKDFWGCGTCGLTCDVLTGV